MSEEETTQVEEVVEETTEKTEEQQTWDKERQRIDQAEANVKKLSDQLSTAAQDKSDLQTRLDAMEKKITEKATEESIELDEVDEDLVGRGVSKNFQKLQDNYKSLQAKMTALEAKATAYEEERATEAEATQRSALINKICKPLDEKFGAKYRNAAEKLANKKITDGDVQAPKGTPAEAALEAKELMDSCYQELYDKDNTKTKKTVPTDTGVGGYTFDTKSVKTGTREEVLADIQKKGLSIFGTKK